MFVVKTRIETRRKTESEYENESNIKLSALTHSLPVLYFLSHRTPVWTPAQTLSQHAPQGISGGQIRTLPLPPPPPEGRI